MHEMPLELDNGELSLIAGVSAEARVIKQIARGSYREASDS